MMEDDMKRNGSGYFDETPVKTGLFGNTPQPGEIWETNQGKEVLVLKNHGAYCSTLFLRPESRADTMEIISREVRHVNPAMLGYIFNRDMGGLIKTIPQEKYLDIMQAVGDRLGVTIKVSRAEEADEVPNDYITENVCLEAELEGTKKRCATIEAECKDLHQQLKEAKQAEVLSTARANVVESLYKDLLKSCLARGEAK